MTKRFFLLAALSLLAQAPISAAHPTAPVDPGTDNNSASWICNLPAPTNFHITSVTSSSVSAAWNPVLGASAYYIKATDNVSQLILDDATVTSPAATLYPPPGSTFDLTVYAICQGQGGTSNNGATLGGVSLIITELIAEMTPPCEDQTTLLQTLTSGSVFLDWVLLDTYWFDVVDDNSGDIARYEIVMHNNNEHCRNMVSVGEVPGSGNGYWDSESQAAMFGTNNYYNPVVNDFYTLRVGRNTLQGIEPVYYIQFDYHFGCSANTDCLEVSFDQADGSYYIDFRAGEQCSPPQECKRERNSQKTGLPGSPPSGLIVQSPFRNALRIIETATEPAAGAVDITLLNLNGQIELHRTFASATTFDLPTGDLPPGIYLLRLERAGVVQTFKVVKL